MNKKPTLFGWGNRETCFVVIWLHSDLEGLVLMREARKQDGESRERAHWLEQRMREQLNIVIEEAGMWRDLLHASFNRINWIEVVGNI